MNLEAQPLGNEYRLDEKESDIVEVFHSLSGLRIIVSTWMDSINQVLLEVYFRRVQAYRYLDEGDLIAYWQTQKFRTSHHVYEITNGGWLTGEALEPGILDVAKSFETREWFVATTNRCMNVVSAVPPSLNDLKAERWLLQTPMPNKLLERTRYERASLFSRVGEPLNRGVSRLLRTASRTLMAGSS